MLNTPRRPDLRRSPSGHLPHSAFRPARSAERGRSGIHRTLARPQLRAEKSLLLRLGARVASDHRANRSPARCARSLKRATATSVHALGADCRRSAAFPASSFRERHSGRHERQPIRVSLRTLAQPRSDTPEMSRVRPRDAFRTLLAVVAMGVAVLGFAACGSHKPRASRTSQVPPLTLDVISPQQDISQRALTIPRGATKRDVLSQAGPPTRQGPRCWIYRWPSKPDSSIDGARLCFRAGRVSLVQTAMHL